MSPSPRPTYPGATVIPRARVAEFVWGDEAAGRVEDLIYVSSGKIHQIVFTLPAGGWFRHSEEHRTVFAADEVYLVLEGTLVLANPETGEVHRVLTGEAAFFRRDTWHHGFAEGPGPVRVLEYMSPPPAAGTSQAYARTRPYLDVCRYTQDEWLGRWPAAASEARARATIQIVRDAEVQWRLEGAGPAALVGLIASTEHLTAGRLRLPGGARTGPRRHGGDAALYLAEGSAIVTLDGGPEQALAPGDGVFVPEGARYELANPGAAPVELFFGVGPLYL